MAVLKNWFVSAVTADPFKAPEQGVTVLCGEVYNSPKFEDGKRITTSRLVARDGDVVITRSGSRYELGEIDPEYEAAYPDAKNRFLNSLPKQSI